VSAYSRTIVARMIASREAHDILGGHLACLLELGAVPRKGMYDNEAALVSRHNGRPNLTERFQQFRGTLGMGVVICKPGDPEAKGLVERAIGYLETSFLPGRRFRDPRTSTPSSPCGCGGPTTACTQRCAAGPPIASARTGRR
jgi:transposase